MSRERPFRFGGAEGAIVAGGGDSGNAVQRASKKVAIGSTGQSNMAIFYDDYSWINSPPTNAYAAQWDKVEGHTVSGFDVISGTVSTSRAFAAYVAAARPELKVYDIIAAKGAMSIDHWSGGVPYTYSTNTTASDPGAGTIKINAGSTAVYVSETDRNGANRFQALTTVDVGGNEGAWVRIEKESDPNVWVRLGTTSSRADNGTWQTIVGSGATTGSGGAPANGDEVRLHIGPDMFEETVANFSAGLELAGKGVLDILLWRQSESDASFSDQYYEDEFETVMARYLDAGVIDLETQIIFFGNVGYEQSTYLPYGRMLETIQKVVAKDPSRRIYVDSTWIPLDYWDTGIAAPVHLLARGYELSGGTAARNYLTGHTWPSVRGVVQDNINDATKFEGESFTGQVYAPGGTTTFPGVAFEEDDNSGLWYVGGFVGISYAGTDVFHANAAGAVTVQNLSGAETLTARAQGVSTVVAETYTDAAANQGGIVAVQRRRGTFASAATMQSGDVYGYLQFKGQVESSLKIGASISATLTEASPLASAVASRIVFNACPAGSDVQGEMARLDHATGLSMFGANVVVDANRHLRLRFYLVGALPSASPAGQLIYVSDGTANKHLAVSDGTNWRWPDGAVVS